MNISILIPTKDRADFILRLLKYYSISNFRGSLLICDSSNSKLFEVNKSNIDKFKNKIDIEYYHKPKLDMFKAISYLCNRVKTDYSALVCDDDLILTDCMQVSINFLDQNKDYSAVHGKALLMGIEDGQCKANGKITSLIEYPVANIKHSKPIDRVESFFNDALNLNMAITRSEINTEAFLQMSHIDSYNASYIFGEMLHASIICARGKIGKVDEYGLLRQFHAEQYFHQIKIIDWMSRPDWRDVYTFLKIVITREVRASEGSSSKSIDDGVSDILSRWVRKMLSSIGDNNKSISNSIYIRLVSYFKNIKFLKLLVRYIMFFLVKNRKNIIHDAFIHKGVAIYLDIVKEKNQNK